MRTSGIFVAAIVFGLMACGGGSGSSGTSPSGRTGSNGGQCPASSKGQTCTGEDAYNNCLTSACGTQVKACFGNNYAKGDFTGSVCADWMNCQMKCPCDATASTCEGACATQYLMTAAGTTCLSCVTQLGTCVQAATSCKQPVCTTTNPGVDAGGTSTGGGCAGASACCDALAALGGATVVQQCKTALAGQTDAVCDQVVTSYKQAGLCP